MRLTYRLNMMLSLDLRKLVAEQSQRAAHEFLKAFKRACLTGDIFKGPPLTDSKSRPTTTSVLARSNWS
jgi:hypothetical protein